MGAYGRIGAAAVAAGSTLIILQMLFWFYAQRGIWTSGGTTAEGQVISFFLLESVCLLLIVLGSYSLYRGLEPPAGRADGGWSIAEVLLNAVKSRRDVRIGVTVGILYAIFYSVVSSMIVYQPSVDFAQAYGATSTSWSAVACCGSYGTIPMIVVYLLPQLHLGLQLVPLDLLLLVVVPILIAFNFAVASFAFRNRPTRSGRVWLSGFGAAVALFTSCPTCAGYFLGGSLGGLAATSLAVALAPYQLAFVLVSLPVLLLSPLLVARSISKSLQDGCRIEKERGVGG